MAATPDDLELENALKASLESFQQQGPAEDDLEYACAISASAIEVETSGGLESKQAVETSMPDEFELALALSASLTIAEEEDNKRKQQAQAQRLREIEAEEKATFELLAQEDLRNAQKEAEEAATQLFLMNERKLQAEQLDNDQLMAEQLAGLERKGSVEEVSIALSFDHVAIEQRLKFLDELELIIRSPAVAGEYSKKEGEGLPVAELTDAHKFTSTLIRAGIPTLRAIDDTLRPINELNPDMPPQAVLAEILAKIEHNPSFSPNDVANISTSINNVIAAGNPIDLAETQAQVPELLSRTWTLAKRLGTNFTAAVATALSDNIADAGGCIPGLVARVYPIYAKMIQCVLKESLESLEAIPHLRIHF